MARTPVQYSSELVARGSGSRRRRVSSDAVLRYGSDAALLGRLAGVLPVPVCGDGLVVPDGGSLGVADVARLAGVVGGIEQQRLHGEGLQVPWLEMGHVLNTEEDTRNRNNGGRYSFIIIVIKREKYTVSQCLIFIFLQNSFKSEQGFSILQFFQIFIGVLHLQ